MGYKKEIIKGVSFTGALRFVTKFVGFLETIILARILVPGQFGAYGIALLALGLLETLTQTGVNVVLIQEKETDKYVSSAWIVSIIRGVIISLVLLIATPFIATFFHSPTSLVLLYYISIVPLLRGFINPAIVKLQKELLFGKNFWYQIIILIVDTATSITVTYITQNPLGIVIGLLAGVFVELVLSYMIVFPRPAFQFEKEYVSRIFHRGKWITATAIFDYLFFNIDNIAVGRILGVSALGIYQLAYSLAVTPLVELGNVFGFVMLPVFTKLSHDGSNLKNAYIKTVLSIIAIAVPIVVIFVIFPKIFVFILGEKWSGITLILPILVCLGFVKSIAGLSYALFWSEVKQRYVTTITFVTIIGMLATLFPLINRYGILGAGVSAFIGSLISLPFILYFTSKIFSYAKNK